MASYTRLFKAIQSFLIELFIVWRLPQMSFPGGCKEVSLLHTVPLQILDRVNSYETLLILTFEFH